MNFEQISVVSKEKLDLFEIEVKLKALDYLHFNRKNLKPETKKDSKVYVCRAHSFTEKKN